MNFFKKNTWQRSVTVLFILVMGVLSTYKSIDITWKQDDVVVRAGQWIGASAVRRAPMITTDSRVAFYAGKGKDYFRYVRSDYRAMEAFALRKGYDVLVIRTSIKRLKSGPQLSRYKRVKEFVGVKNIVSIYFSPSLQKGLAGESSK
jgi:hypothetical protein